MVRTCPSTMAPPSASASGATSATKTLNIFLESSSPTAETITAKAVGLGTEVFEANRVCHSGVSTPPQFSLDVDVQQDATETVVAKFTDRRYKPGGSSPSKCGSYPEKAEYPTIRPRDVFPT